MPKDDKRKNAPKKKAGKSDRKQSSDETIE